MKDLKTQDLVLCALFAALMGVGANLSPFLMIGSVPITLQLLFAILAGAVLGSRKGSIAMLVYVFVGLIGAPVFAQFKGGPAQLLSPTFGFVLSFVAVAYVAGKWVGDSQLIKPKHYFMAGTLSLFCNYIIGTNWMYFALLLWADAPAGFSYGMAWGWMLAYFPLDLAVTALSFFLVPKLKQALRRTHHLNTEM